MADNAQKTPFAKTQNRFAEKKILDAIQILGKALPCSVAKVQGSIITVKFEVQSGFTLPIVTMPMFGPEYIRYPTQIGDKGVVFPADARLGGVSGLGGGVADLSTPANLSALVFFPISNTAWFAVDPNAVTIYGPNGVVLQNTDATSTIVLTPDGIVVTGKDFVNVVCGDSEISMTPTTYQITGATGSILATTALTIQDAAHQTSPTLMNTVWAALTLWANSHTHPVSGGVAQATGTPYTGGSIAP